MYSVETDKKMQEKWEKLNIAKFDKANIDKKYYCLEMFSYPSGAKLHLGHWYNYGLTDTFARYKKMQGYEVFQPMGFDAFGLPAENYAIKTGIHPKDSTLKNIETMEKQLKSMGALFNWDAELITCNEDYYRWTEWIFLKLYEKGLAYRKKASVNFCPSCNTVLANEQVIEGTCERCGSGVYKKELEQWFLKITEYAEELLEKLDTLDWPEKTKKIQTNWIGKSTGSTATFAVDGKDITFDIFSTRIDTLYGVTYVVIAPEHEIVEKITTDEQKVQVEEYIEACKKITEIDRLSETREKTGVFTGSYAINPINNEKVPIWIADYVLSTYGTGCVMAVPAHDERDFEFAKKYNLPIKQVIVPENKFIEDKAYIGDGVLTNSSKFDGQTVEEAKENITKELKQIGKGDFKITYRLRDWLVSRQRYWGAPIPIIHCDKCGIVPVSEKDLPVRLPYNVEFRAAGGESPLAKSEEFMNVKCPKCGHDAKRDPDTLDTFVCSSWYQFRYPDNKNSEKIFDTDFINKMLPVDKYVGGAEHAAMHLLYSRFITKVLRDLGYTNVDEPFKSLVHQGTILGPDGSKMSKSKGNVISPDEYIEKYGSDVFRLYLMFAFAYTDGGPWSNEGIDSMAKFVSRLERILVKINEETIEGSKEKVEKTEKEFLYLFNNNIKAITDNMEIMQFNTAVARIMEIVNELYKYDLLEKKDKNIKLLKTNMMILLRVIAPFMPHFAESMWEQYGGEFSIFNNKWPKYDEKYLQKDEIEMPVIIKGNVKFKIEIEREKSVSEIEKIVKEDERLTKYISANEIKKIIVVPGKIINIVV